MINKNITNYLPHKYPFLFVDEILCLKKYNYILTIKNITISEFYFTGHFPTKPIVPGIIIIESLAQTGGLLANISLGIKVKYPNFYLGSVNNTKFKKIVSPGDQLYLEVKIKNIKKMAWKFTCQAFVDGSRVCFSHITCVRNYETYR